MGQPVNPHGLPKPVPFPKSEHLSARRQEEELLGVQAIHSDNAWAAGGAHGGPSAEQVSDWGPHSPWQQPWHSEIGNMSISDNLS